MKNDTHRLLMLPENIASEKVAVKNGYLKEGILHKALTHKDGSKEIVIYMRKHCKHQL
jgi:RimJ/RimL family protein N-acetyltransferase